jgi:carboxyl-terminal processing protease
MTSAQNPLPQLSGNRKNLQMKRRNTLKNIVVMVGLAILVTIPAAGQMLNEGTFKLGRLFGLIDAFYVDSVNMNRITDRAIIDLLKTLDPHSAYIPADEVKEMNEPLMGNFDGIGVQFNLLDDSVLIISPVPGGPSEKVGILPGDRIITVNGENIAGTGITTTGVRNKLMGEKGSTVTVGIYRKGVRGITDYTITRDKIPVNSLDAAYMLDSENGYVKLNRFAATTDKEFFDAIAKLKAEGMKNIVIDLRGNTGGFMNPSITIADAFFPQNKMIVYLEGNKTPRQDFLSTSEAALLNARLVVLTDEGSASASEILAGAIQDWDRGVVVGRRTFGKGLVQNGFYLTDGSMVRLTIARYYTPAGRSIQSTYADGYDKYMENYLKRYTNGELITADSVHFPDSLRGTTLTNKRIVYSGGGIMPDLFVGADTSNYSDYYRDVVRKGVVTRFSLGYTDKNRKRLKSEYLTFDDFNKRFNFDEETIKTFIAMAEEMGVGYNESEFKTSRQELLKIMKGLVARDLWDMSEYYRIVNQDDIVILKALEVISDKSRYNAILGY